MKAERSATTLFDLLPTISSGSITVTVSGYPLVSIRSDKKELDLEVKGMKEAGLSLPGLIRLQEGRKGILSASGSIAKKLSDLGWRLTLYDRGGKLVTMGRGAPKLTGHIATSPLKLKKLMDALR